MAQRSPVTAWATAWAHFHQACQRRRLKLQKHRTEAMTAAGAIAAVAARARAGAGVEAARAARPVRRAVAARKAVAAAAAKAAAAVVRVISVAGAVENATKRKVPMVEGAAAPGAAEAAVGAAAGAMTIDTGPDEDGSS